MKRFGFFKAALGTVLAAALALGCVPIYASASVKTDKIEDELGTLKSENADIQAEIDAVRQQYTAASNQIQELVNQKNAVDQEIALLHSQILNMNQQIIVYGQLIADSQDDLEEQSQQLDELNEKHKARIRAMEEGGTVSYWEVLFQAKSFTDFLDRMTMIDEIAASDQRRLEEIQQVADDLSTTQTRSLPMRRPSLRKVRACSLRSERSPTSFFAVWQSRRRNLPSCWTIPKQSRMP